MTAKVCYHDPKLDIVLSQHGVDNFTIRYFKQITSGLTYAAAATELGTCIMHALACNGELDNRERGER